MNNYYMKNLKFKILLVLIIIASLGGGFLADRFYFTKTITADNLSMDEQELTIRAINKVMPSVVSIIVYDFQEVAYLDVSQGTKIIKKEKKEKGSGTGFIISSDGLILTNKHVINVAEEKTANYRIILNNGKQYYAVLIGKDPLNDLAVLKIYENNLPVVELGDSDKISIGATVIGIGNSLGRYQNSATKGIVSGLGRSLVASDLVGNSEKLDNVIQTDAEINPGNSGGPLINLDGKVVGINVAIDEGGSAIGFAIPVNDARQVVNSVKKFGAIKRPQLGVRYVMITPELFQDNKLSRETGALITRGENDEPAISAGSVAEKAGLQEGDVIFEINGIKIEGKNTLLSIVQRYKPGDKIGLKIQRGSSNFVKVVTLEEFK
jgi:S1-C subfamily serine protease